MNARFVIAGCLTSLAATLLSGCGARHAEDEEKVVTEVTVQTGKVTRVTLRARVDAYGRVEPEPAGAGKPAGGARLSAPAAGLVTAVPAKEGEPVEAGAVIVKLDDRLALAQLEKARHAVEFSGQQLARQEKLKAVEGTSEKALEDARQQLAAARAELAVAQAQLGLVQLTSPLSGLVAAIHVQPGQTVEPNTIVAEVVDPARLVVTARVPAPEDAALKVGQRAELLTGNLSASSGKGQVLFISPQVEASGDTTLVRISVPTEAGVRPGQFIRVSIVTEERVGKLAVPREAVYTDHEGQTTLSIVEGDKAIQKVVKAGLRDDNLVEVEGEGVAEGTTVVTVGSYALPKETKIHIVNPQQEAK